VNNNRPDKEVRARTTAKEGAIMLVLTRKKDESVIVGNSIEVKILEVRGDHVSLGFSAPRQIPIYRKEVFEAIQSENRQAVGPGAGQIEKIQTLLRS
jgi:carbon storage regulator